MNLHVGRCMQEIGTLRKEVVDGKAREVAQKETIKSQRKQIALVAYQKHSYRWLNAFDREQSAAKLLHAQAAFEEEVGKIRVEAHEEVEQARKATDTAVMEQDR